MNYSLRPYQTVCLEGVAREFSCAQRTLMVMPTGTGKTVVFGSLARDWPQGRVMIVAHRDILINQAAQKLYELTGEEPDIEMASMVADQDRLNGKAHCVVSSVQTLNSGRKCKACDNGCERCLAGRTYRMQRFDPSDFGLLVIDEAHHAPATTYLRMVEWFARNPTLKVLGVTATPDRADERALGQVFQTAAYVYEIVNAKNDGWLVPIVQQYVTIDSLDLSGIGTVAGDLNQGQLASQMELERHVQGVASTTMQIAQGRKTLVFAVSVDQAELISAVMNDHDSGCAEFICADTKRVSKQDRDQIIERYRRGEFPYLVNVGIATEGFDVPEIEVVSMARPTKSRAFYAQCCGRGTRPIEKYIRGLETAEERRSAIARSPKPKLTVIDFVGNSGRHKLVSTPNILGGKYPDAVVERARQKLQDDPQDVQEALQEAEREVRETRRLERDRLAMQAKFRSRLVDPFELLDIVPEREPGWHRGRRPTEKQLAFLERKGVEKKWRSEASFTQASQMIGELIERSNNDMATYKQTKLLKKYGVDALEMNFQQACAEIDRIAKNGWRRR